MLVYFIVILAIAARFVPHMPNFAPITALAIFSGAYMSKKQALGVTLAARLVSDVFLGFFAWPLMIAVYACHAVGVLLGAWIQKKSSQQAETGAVFGISRSLKIVASSLFASVLFFLVTNFAFFYPTYSHSWAGIMQAYVNGLPFFRGTFTGDLVYVAAFFGAYEFVQFGVRQKSKPHEKLAS